MYITAKVIIGIAEPIEGLFCMWNPSFAVEGILKLLPLIRITQPGAGIGKQELPSRIKLMERVHEHPPELTAKDALGDEKMRAAGNQLPGLRKSGPRNDGVDMGMEIQFLASRMKYLYDTGDAA